MAAFVEKNKNKSLLEQLKVRTTFVTRMFQTVEIKSIASKNLEQITSTVQVENDLHYLTLRIPEAETRRAIFFVCVIDVSGSMDFQVTKAEGGKYFTRLDLVKHVLNVLIDALTEKDYLSLITFSDESKVLMKAVQMDDKQKEKARDYVKNLKTEGGTYTFNGIKDAYEQIKTTPKGYAKSIILLTDGEDTEGSDKLIKNYNDLLRKKNTERVQLNTFGFSSAVDSQCLNSIAELGDGIFGFIPDQTMIGTIFINFLAYTFLTYAQEVEIKLDKNFEFELPTFNQSSISNCLTLYYGQTRTFIIKKKQDAKRDAKFTASIGISNDEYVPLNMQEKKDLEIIKLQNARKHVVSYIRKITKSINYLNNDSSNEELISDTIRHLKDVPLCLAEFQQIDEYDPNNEQLALSLKYYDSWGKHYLRSMYYSHYQEQCLNFKSPSMKMYNDEKVNDLVEFLTDKFCNLPPPNPSGTDYGYSDSGAGDGGGMNFSDLMDPRGGCILGECKIRMANGEFKQIKELKKGDKVFGDATIVCLIKMKYNGSLVKLNNLCITPFHPIFYENKWQFPIDTVTSCNKNAILVDCLRDNYVYNIVLDKNHVVDVDGIGCVTLGHGFDDGILKHQYYGTEKVIDDLKSLDGWDQGFIELNDIKVIRDSNGLVSHIIYV